MASLSVVSCKKKEKDLSDRLAMALRYSNIDDFIDCLLYKED